MKRILALICILALVCSTGYAEGMFGGIFSGLLPTPSPTPVPTPTPIPTPTPVPTPTPIPTPTPVPTPTPAPTATPAAEAAGYWTSAGVAQLLGTATVGTDGTVAFSPVTLQHLAAFLLMLDAEQMAALHYDCATQTLTVAPAMAQPTSTQAPAPAKRNESVVDDDCSHCGGLRECQKCYGDGEFYCDAGCIGGRCIACDDGKVLVGFDSKGNAKYRNCSKCRNGDCKKCGGDGYYDCSYCTGGRCPYC